MSCNNASLHSYKLGQIVRLSSPLSDGTGTENLFESGGVAIDPPGVQCKTVDPNGAAVVYVYPTDSEFLVRDSEGNYSCYVLAAITGKWSYKWYAMDADTPLNQRVAGVGEHAFLVELSDVDGAGSPSGGSSGGIDGGSP